MRQIKRSLSLFLTACMIFSMTLMNVGAAEVTEDTTAVISEAEEVSAQSEDLTAEPSSEILTEGTSQQPEESVTETQEPATVSQETGETVSSEPETTAGQEDTSATQEEVTSTSETSEAETETAAEENTSEDATEEDGNMALMSLMAFYSSDSEARDTSSDDFYRIVHVDAGRKYFSPENIKKIIDTAAEAGFNQVELYLSDNQGFRFALDDMTVTTSTGNTYDLTPALGDGYSDGSKYPDGSGKYLTQSEMTGIISYAKEKEIDIVPCINVPGHMGAILEAFTKFRYSGSKSSIDLENAEAVAFALAITQKYAAYFASQGVRFYNLGADEYANDLSTMGFQGLYTSGKYKSFVDFLNAAAEIVIKYGMTPRAFNDGICYNNDTSYSIKKEIQVCYWSSGWSGYNVASAATLYNAGYQMINTHGDYYWVLGNSSWQCSAEKAAGFDYTSFQGGTISDPAGAMFCIWCDVGNADGTDDGAAVVTATADVIKAFGTNLPSKANEMEKGDVKVAASGLTGLDYEKVTENIPEVESAAEGKVIAYNIKPATALGDYTGKGTVSIKVPEGWNTSRVRAFIVTDGTVETISGECKDGWYTFTAPHFSVMGLYEAEKTPVEVTENETITVTVGQTATATISGANYAGTYTTEDPSIATVKVTGTDATEATTTYTQASVTCNTLISSNKYSWTAVSGYYYKADDGNYYPVYAKRSRSLSWSGFTYTYTWGYSATSSTSNVTQIGTQSTTDTSTTPNITVYTKSATDGTPASTTVTFTGIAVGTTYVTVGNTRYTINVTDNPPEGALTDKSLTVEYWITNNLVYEKGSTSSATSKSIASTEAEIEEGIEIDTIVPEIAYSNYDGWLELHFWQAMRLDSNNHQTAGAGDDETSDGSKITHVRYYGNAWQYKTSDGKWNYFMQDDQAVAYYMRYTEITKEITTAMKDWGYGTDSTTPDTSSKMGQVALSVAVVYPDGTISPTENDIYGKSTVIFNYWENRDIGIIAPLNNSDYEISKITVTDGTRTDNSESNTWKSDATISWNKLTNAAGTEWYDEETVWEESMGTEPVVNGKASSIIWSKKNTAKLILIYLKPIEKDTNLLVRWVDDSDNGALIFSSQIVVTSVGNSETTFYSALKQSSKVPEKDTADFTLDDDAYVTNSSGVNQTFNKDITTIPGVEGKYTSGLYQYETAEISGEGKVLILHYKLNLANLRKEYVIDFGLSVKVPLSSLIDNTENVQSVAVSTNAKYDEENSNIIYTPTNVLSGVEAVTVRVTYNNKSDMSFSIGFIPATTVYYEEGFASFTGFSNGSKGSGYQETEAVDNKKNNYGYDSYYSSPVGASNGTEAVSTRYGDKAEFTFTGTGVDIYANCTGETGQLFIQVKNSSGSTVKMVQVVTALVNGESNLTQDQSVDGYNVPVASLDLEARDTYTVIITHRKPSSEATGDTVKLDGFRVYGTLDTSDAVYTTDGEKEPQFVELRDSVLQVMLGAVSSDSEIYASQIADKAMEQVYALGKEVNALVINPNLDTGEVNVTDLIDNGPKNEIYLRSGETLVFKTNATGVQIGLKALNSSVTYNINGGVNTTLSSSTDMFYSINSGEITITNQSKSVEILAITKLKLFGATAPETVTTETLSRALVAMGYAAGAPSEPEVTYADALLQIEVKDGETVVADTSLTANGVAGETHTFTAAEIQSAAAELILPDGSKLDEAVYADVSVAYGESQTVVFTASKDETEAPTVTEKETEESTEAETEENTTQETTEAEQPANRPGSILDKVFNAIGSFFDKLFGKH